MAGIIANRDLIAAPQPGALRYGLFAAATVTDDLGAVGVRSGFQFAAHDCGGPALVYDANCATHPVKTFEEGLDYVGGDPYWLYATRQCGTVGNTPAEVTASIRRKFLAGEQTAVEDVFWTTGTEALVTLAGVTTVVPTAPGAGAAIAALEESFYSAYGYTGVIHINTAGYAAARYAGLVERQGAALQTPIGSRWSIGAGYGINGPLNVAPAAGSVWAFMTPPVYIKRSDVMIPDVVATMDRTTNQYMALAERVYAHALACDEVHAVQVPIAAPAVDTEAAQA